MEDAADGLLIEEREERMVSRNGGDEFLKIAHFLTPSGNSSAAVPAAPPAAKYNSLPLKVVYHGWKRPQENWTSWVDELHSSHCSTWKTAGILDAIVASKCIIPRCNHLILELVDKWCPRTNSFVFPWGESSITLEDIAVLGGYPVLGESVLIPLENEEMVETMKKLESARSKMYQSARKGPALGKWVAQFKGIGGEIEHAAFLSYWLSRFVFPSSRDAISRRVFPIAVHLCRGTQIALAPTILASVYKSLTILKAAIILATKSGKTKPPNSEFLEVAVPAPLVFVQVWIWERIPYLRPMLVSNKQSGRPRLSRWDGVKLGAEFKSMSIDCCIGRDFQWRPYAECSEFFGLVYREDEGWETVNSDLEGFVRCLRCCELVSLDGDDCMEQYLPHRVAMQFGMDQDIPGDVERVNGNWEVAWKHYNRSIRDTKLYVPARLSEPHVTTRYLAWWNSHVVGTNEDLFGRKSEADVLSSIPPGFSRAWKKGKAKDVQKKSALCSSKNLKLKIKFPTGGPRKFVGSSSGVKKSDCDKGIPRPKSVKRRRRRVEILSGEECDDNINGGKGSCNSSKKRRKTYPPIDFHEVEATIENNQEVEEAPTVIVDEQNESRGAGMEERIGIAEKLVAFLQAGKLVKNGWYKKLGENIWTPWFIKYIHSRSYFNIYTNFLHERALSISDRDAGVNYGKTGGPDSRLLDKSSLDFNLLELYPLKDLKWYNHCFREVFPNRILRSSNELGPVVQSVQKNNSVKQLCVDS